MDKKAWIIFFVIVAAVFGGLVYMSDKNQVDVSNNDGAKIQAASPESGGIADHVFGNKDSKVVLIEYADFQCPGCKAAHPNVKSITEKYQDKIAFVFRNFPLTSIHPNALAAASAVEAAGLQGKYWQMNNLVFESSDQWERSTTEERTKLFVGYAKQLGLDAEKFKADMASEKVSKKIAFDMSLGKKQNISGTPSFILNGTSLSDTVVDDIMKEKGEKLEAALDAALKEHDIAPPSDKK